MNLDHSAFIEDTRLKKLWSPFPELESTWQLGLSNLLLEMEKSGTLEEYAIKAFSKAVVTEAADKVPVYQMEKVAYRIRDTLKGVILWAEEKSPDIDVFDARKQCSFFESMGGYAKRLVQEANFAGVMGIVRDIKQQKTGKANPEAVFLNSVLDEVLASDNEQYLLSFFDALTMEKDNVFSDYTAFSKLAEPQALVRTIKHAGNGRLNINNVNVISVMSGIYCGVGHSASNIGVQQSERIMSAIEGQIASDIDRAYLLVDYNAQLCQLENDNFGQSALVRNVAKFFNPALVLGHSCEEEIRRIIGGKHSGSWRREVAINWCRTFDPDNICTEHHILRMLSKTPEENNREKLHSGLAEVIDGLRYLGDAEKMDGYYQRDWEDNRLLYAGTTGDLALRVLREFTSFNLEKNAKDGLNHMSRSVISRVNTKIERENHILHLWGIIKGCGVEDEAKNYLADFYKDNFASLDFFIKQTGQNHASYMKHEWFRESLLQSDLGL